MERFHACIFDFKTACFFDLQCNSRGAYFVLTSSYMHGMVYVAICLKMHMLFCFMHFMLIYAMAFENAYAFEMK